MVPAPDLRGTAGKVDAAYLPALRWRTRDTTRHLLHAYLGGFGVCLVTGLLLWLDWGGASLVTVMLVTHLMAGALGLIFFIPYLLTHLKDGREPWLNLVWPWRLIPELRWEPYAWKRLHGHLLMWSNGLLLLSGFVTAFPAVLYLAGHPLTLPYGASAWLLVGHQVMTVASLALMLLHFPARDRK
ncbi:MAG TPA: hypothetical protein PKH69_05460 [Thiobacillaceae bacterium]|nr:hypothetical protein [Thiobacillaceae bacterium]